MTSNRGLEAPGIFRRIARKLGVHGRPKPGPRADSPRDSERRVRALDPANYGACRIPAASIRPPSPSAAGRRQGKPRAKRTAPREQQAAAQPFPAYHEKPGATTHLSRRSRYLERPAAPSGRGGAGVSARVASSADTGVCPKSPFDDSFRSSIDSEGYRDGNDSAIRLTIEYLSKKERADGADSVAKSTPAYSALEPVPSSYTSPSCHGLSAGRSSSAEHTSSTAYTPSTDYSLPCSSPTYRSTYESSPAKSDSYSRSAEPSSTYDSGFGSGDYYNQRRGVFRSSCHL